MPRIPIEDNFNDIIGKAQRGLQLTDAMLTEKAGVAPDELAAVKKGEVRDLPIRKLAKVLKLEREHGDHVRLLVLSRKMGLLPIFIELGGEPLLK